MITINEYIEFRSKSDNDNRDDSFFCSSHGITADALCDLKTQNPSWPDRSLSLRRASYAQKVKEIDDALFEAARGGDTKAAELFYRRFDHWHPSVVEQTNNFYNFTDIIKAASKYEREHSGDDRAEEPVSERPGILFDESAGGQALEEADRDTGEPQGQQ